MWENPRPLRAGVAFQQGHQPFHGALGCTAWRRNSWLCKQPMLSPEKADESVSMPGKDELPVHRASGSGPTGPGHGPLILKNGSSSKSSRSALGECNFRNDFCLRGDNGFLNSDADKSSRIYNITNENGLLFLTVSTQHIFNFN